MLLVRPFVIRAQMRLVGYRKEAATIPGRLSGMFGPASGKLPRSEHTGVVQVLMIISVSVCRSPPYNILGRTPRPINMNWSKH